MRTRIFVSCGIALLCSACAREGGETDAFVVRDSAGVRIVESTDPEWSESETWRFGENPLVQIGGMDGDPNYELYRVIDALRLSDGRLVIANSGTHELRFYDAEGRYLSASGGQGDGPGEFQALWWTRPFRGDSLITYDLRQRRLSVFDTAGRFQRSIMVMNVGETIVRASGVFSDGSFLSYGSRRRGPDAPSGLLREESHLFRHSESGELIDSLGAFLGSETFVRPLNGGMMMMQPFFGRSTEFFVQGALFYVATNDSYEIKAYAQDGTLRSVTRRHFAHLNVTEEDVQAVREQVLGDDMPAEMQEMLEEVVNAMPTPETMPAYSSALLDDVGNLWVEEYRQPDDEVRRWTVFDTGGVLLGTLLMPTGCRMLSAGHDFLLGTWRDELDVEYVQMYALMKGEG
jgi:hypothetical protein